MSILYYVIMVNYALMAWRSEFGASEIWMKEMGFEIGFIFKIKLSFF